MPHAVLTPRADEERASAAPKWLRASGTILECPVREGRDE